ncbi:MAG: hypothetical protein ACTSU5_10860 [Promethearchaeota archaeon]
MVNMASTIALVSGASAVVLISTGIIAGIMCIVRYFKEGAHLLLWAGILLIMVGSFYLGTVVSFVKLLITGTNLEPGYWAGRLCYTHAPFAAALAMYMGFSIINKEKFARIMTVVFLCTAPLYWYGLWFQPETTILTEVPIEGGKTGLIDIQLLSYVQVLTFVYLVSFLAFVAGAFYWMAGKSSGKLRRKFYELAVGFTGFVICGAIDSMVDLAYGIVIPRFFMVVSYLLMYIGFNRTD